MADFKKIIQQVQEVVDATPADHPDRADRLGILGAVYHYGYQRTGTMTDLETAIRRYQEALDATPADHSDRAGRLHDLGAGYHDRYHRRTGTMTDLETAIRRCQEALDTTPADHSDRADRLHDLGAGYHDRYRRTGTMTDLETAIRRLQEALDTTSADHPDRADRLHDLGAGYHDRYRRTETMTDLETAIRRLQEALDTTSADHPDRADRLHELGAGYHDRYRRTGTMADLETALQRLQEALDATPADHSDRADRLNSLGVEYHARYRRTGTMADLETALQRCQEALDATPADHSHRADRLYRLGVEYHARYRRTGTMADLETALQRCQEALDATPADHSHRADRLGILGTIYRNRYLRSETMADLETAISLFQETLDQSLFPVTNRLMAGRVLLDLHANVKNWPQAHQAASKTVSLVPLLTLRSLETSDKQHLLTKIIDLASNASAMALNAAKTPFDAIQALELGRGVITGSINELRADIFDLQQKHPQLAEEYVTLRDQLDSSTISTTQREVDQRYTAGQELERVIEKIQRLPDFDRFLRASSDDDLKTAAECGPVVIINVSDYRCDALIIEKFQIQALRLPDLHVRDIRARATETLAEPRVLEWLWDTIAQPVLDTLGFTQNPSSGCWPHIWWIPTGLLAKFPIHAAGYHSQSSSDAVLDRVISSYSSSVKTIIYGRRHRPQRTRRSKSEEVILLAMLKTPEQEDLQFAPREIQELEKLFSSRELHVSKPSPYKEQVLSALSNCKIFHFAGHGSTHESDPSGSLLLLKDWKTEPLTVASLLKTNLRKQTPFLAYLSACGTGRIKSNEHLDEGLHLISAYQLAGFRHVIGTLWEVNDKSCVEMAKTTYEWMLDHEMNNESVSEGLHHASRRLRGQWIEDFARETSRRDKGLRKIRHEQVTIRPPDSRQGEARDPRDVELCEDTKHIPLYWVPYVHYGF